MSQPPATVPEDEEEVTLEGTLALIKPDAVAKERDIVSIIRDEGFLIVERRRVRFSLEGAEEFYMEHANKPFYRDLVSYMTSGDVIAYCLARENGIEHWRHLLGPADVTVAMREEPNSLRARFGNPKAPMYNALHGSDSPASSEREIEMIFPHILHGGDTDDEEEDDATKAGAAGGSEDEEAARDELGRSVMDEPKDNKDYLNKFVCPTLLKGLSEMYETRPESPIAWLSDWLVDNNPYKERPAANSS